jgi:predicted NACHT family NTPase
MAEPLLIAKHASAECHLLPALANRHGLITGATGTGKTVTLQTLAEKLLAHRRAGVHGRRQGRPHRHQPGRQHRRKAGRPC